MNVTRAVGSPWARPFIGYSAAACSPTQGSGDAATPHGHGAASVMAQGMGWQQQRRPRLHQRLPFRTAPDPRALLSAVVRLPQGPGETAVPYYLDEEIEAAARAAAGPTTVAETIISAPMGDNGSAHQGGSAAEGSSAAGETHPTVGSSAAADVEVSAQSATTGSGSRSMSAAEGSSNADTGSSVAVSMPESEGGTLRSSGAALNGDGGVERASVGMIPVHTHVQSPSVQSTVGQPDGAPGAVGRVSKKKDEEDAAASESVPEPPTAAANPGIMKLEPESANFDVPNLSAAV